MSNLSKIKSYLKADPKLLDMRESYLRHNGLLHVVFGAMSKSPDFRHNLHQRVPQREENIVKVNHSLHWLDNIYA
jgi:hypothetical protein